MQLSDYDTFATLSRQGESVRAGATTLDPNSPDDRIHESETALLNDASGLWRVRKQYTYPNEGATAATRYLLTESRSKIAGFSGDETQSTYSLDALGNWQQQVTEERVAERLRIERATSNGFSGESVSIQHGGLTVEQRRPGDTLATRMSYDALGRLVSSKQPHHAHGDSILYAAGGNQVLSRTDASGATTSYGYFPQGSTGAGRVAAVTRADLTVARSAYDLRGNKTREWGSAAAPTAYGFDGYNQLETLATYRTEITADSPSWPTAIGTADVTTWVREDATGLLLQKLDADSKGSVYDHDIAGRITRRTSARGLITDFTYTAWGQPDLENYADATPDVDLNYDRVGRKTRESNGVATSDYQYSPVTLRPTLETITYDLDRDGTPELTRQLDRSHDDLRRPTGFTLKDGTTLENQAIYGYDADGRLSQVSNSQLSNTPFTYSYIQNSNLLHQVTGPAHSVTNTWEPDRDVLDVKENKVGSTMVSRFDYAVNAIGQRTAISQTGTAFASARGIAWGYDSYGQVTTADSSITGQDRAYQYDAIGNRKKSADSLTLPVADNYVANALNQYTAVNTVNPVHDSDGNATAYPLPVAPTANSTLVWDSENRLVSATVGSTTKTTLYDAQSRRIAETSGNATTIYLYEGWNCIAEYSYSALPVPTSALSKTRLWGLDLSGTMQGAGGVGGLLCESQISNSLISNYYPTYDGNGNVSEYLASNGSVAAHFEYDPFGNTVVNTDTGNQFSYKFSTKQQDSSTGLYYYGYRSYDPALGFWLCRDPIEEKGGANLYSIIGNDLVNRLDLLGLMDDTTIQLAGEKQRVENYRIVLKSLDSALWRTQARYYAVGKELDLMISRLSNRSLLDKECDKYKVMMSMGLLSAKYNVNETISAIQKGIFTSVSPTAPEDGEVEYILPPWMWARGLLYMDPDKVGQMENGWFFGNVEVNGSMVDEAIADGDWAEVEDTMFHEMSHVGAHTIDGSSNGFSNDTSNFELLNRSIGGFIDMLHGYVNGKLAPACRCWEEIWWK